MKPGDLHEQYEKLRKLRWWQVLLLLLGSVVVVVLATALVTWAGEETKGLMTTRAPTAPTPIPTSIDSQRQLPAPPPTPTPTPAPTGRHVRHPQALIDALLVDRESPSLPIARMIIDPVDASNDEQTTLVDEIRKAFTKARWEPSSANTSGLPPFTGIKVILYAGPNDPKFNAAFAARKNALREAIKLLGNVDVVHTGEDESRSNEFLGLIVVGPPTPKDR